MARHGRGARDPDDDLGATGRGAAVDDDPDLTPRVEGQVLAQREIAAALQHALEARRQRIIASRASAAISMGIYAAAVAAAVLMITAHNRPFTGEISVGPEVLLHVMPEERVPPR
jgi:hypothetical protein